MRAAVCRTYRAPQAVEDLRLAPPGPGEVLVDVRACAICHSDIHAAEGAWGDPLPAVFGHEAAGVVRAVGPGTSGVAPGDHVAISFIRACGVCVDCAAGAPVRCRTRLPLDEPGRLALPDGTPVLQGVQVGAFAEQVVVHRSQVAGIDHDLAFDVASLLGCGVITGFGGAVNAARVHPGDSVAVLGCGGVGLNAVQGAATAGGRPVIALDPVAGKREAALHLGATHAVDPSAGDAADTVRDLTRGRGADHVLVAVGAATAVEDALALVARGGQVVLLGMPASGETAAIEPLRVAYDEVRIVGSRMGSSRLPVDIPALVDHYRAGRLRLDELITARYPLDRLDDAIAAVVGGEALRNVIVL